MLWHENQGVTDLPPLQESRPRDFQTRRGKEYGNLDVGQSSRPHTASASEWCPIELEVLDGVASCMTLFLIQVANV